MRMIAGAVLACCLAAAPAAAQTAPSCRFLCAPQVLIEPTLTIESLARSPRRVFELVLAADIPTTVPRLGFTAETIFSPFARDNAVEVELEVNIGVVHSAQTRGWVSSHVDVVDKFSPAERPGDRGAYTHKLNFEWDTALAPFNRLPERRWLRNVEIEGSLDYVATGLPPARDADRWSFSLVLVLPITP